MGWWVLSPSHRESLTMTEFERWLIGRINWTTKQLRKAIEQQNDIFRIIYQASLDVLEETLRVYQDIRTESGIRRVECSECPHQKVLEQMKEMLKLDGKLKKDK